MAQHTAIVGAGLMGRWHADAVRRTGGHVVLVVDPDPARAGALARPAGGAAVATRLDPVALAEVAAVAHVCTPLPTHGELAGLLLDAGVHLLVEKPLTERAQETAALLERALARGVLLCPVHQFGFQRGVRRVLDSLASLGPVRHLAFEACSAGADGGDDAARDRLVADVLPHPLSLLAELLPEPVAGLEWQVARPGPGELRAVAVSGGATIDLLVSTHGRPTTNVLRVIGEHGSATADLFHGFAIVQHGRVSRARKVAQPFGLAGLTGAAATANLVRRAWRREPAYPGLRELVRAFHLAAASGGPPPIPGAVTLDVASARDRLIEATR
jgi:predicted dehydrogenase